MTQLLHVANETPVSGAVSRPLELEHILAKEPSASAMRFFLNVKAHWVLAQFRLTQ